MGRKWGKRVDSDKRMNELKGRIRGRREIEKGWGKETGNRDRREKSCNAKGTKGKAKRKSERKKRMERGIRRKEGAWE